MRTIRKRHKSRPAPSDFFHPFPPRTDGLRAFLDDLEAPLPHEVAANPWPDGEDSPAATILREACRYDLKKFAQEFFPELCRVEFNPMHEDFFAEADREAQQHLTGVRSVDVAPRGSGKTSTRLKIKPIHRALYGISKYYLICSAEYRLANDKVKDLRDIFETNAKLRQVYGPQETLSWRQDDFIIAAGCRYRAFTPKSRTRGLLWGAYRPTDILLDDAEDRDTVLTELRRMRFEKWFFEDVARLGDPQTNIELIGTLLHPESFLANMLKKTGWRRRKYQGVIHFAESAEAIALWRAWRERVIDMENPHALDDAKAFFDANEAAMMEGVKVLWPQWRSYYDMMLERLTQSEHAFWQEDQNEPALDSSYLFDADAIMRFKLVPDGILREDGRHVPWLDIEHVVAFYDSTPGDNPSDTTRDWAACPVVAQDKHGYQYLVDLYAEQQDKSSEQINAIVDLCWRWQVEKLGMEAIGHQATLVDSFIQGFAARGREEHHQWSPMLVPVKDVRNKILRIRTLEPRFSNKWLWVNETIPGRFWQEVSHFTTLTKDNADDCLDALSGAVHMLVIGES